MRSLKPMDKTEFSSTATKIKTPSHKLEKNPTYRGVPLVEGILGFVVGERILDDELLRRFDFDKLPDDPDEEKIVLVNWMFNWKILTQGKIDQCKREFEEKNQKDLEHR